MKPRKILHFSIGPVQEFVSQARRTRDLWAGSFLLSWLSGVAMHHIMHNKGKIDFPCVGTLDHPLDPIVACLAGCPIADQPAPHIGSLVNRFCAILSDDVSSQKSDECLAKEAAKQVRQRWEALADAVYAKFIFPVAVNACGGEAGLKARWDTQIQHFWRFTWVLDEEERDENGNRTDGSWLDVRKSWYTHWPKAQGGDHCTLMGDCQEISGYVRYRQRKEQDRFWAAVINQKEVGLLELREGERLCAVALVKRLFAKLDVDTLIDTIGWVPGGKPEAVGNWPSTAYMAAIPWLKEIESSSEWVDELKSYAKLMNSALGGKQFRRLISEQATDISGLDRLYAEKVTVNHQDRALCALDGNLFHYDALRNFRATPLTDKAMGQRDDPDKADRESFLTRLTQINSQLGKAAQPFYALLLMDGDGLGKLLQSESFDNSQISRILQQFTKSVSTIVRDPAYQGVTLYAGGDDVMALLPITHAAECAIALRQAYTAAAEEVLGAEAAKAFTASVAVVYAHYGTPLQAVVRQAHHQLDDVAKEGNGRDSLALTVFKPQGVTAHWVGKFGALTTDFLAFLKSVVGQQFSTGFFYNLHQRYPLLSEAETLPEHLDIQALLMAEYCKGKTVKAVEEQKLARNSVEKMWEACRCQRGDEAKKTHFQIGGAFVARFIADTGFHFGRRRDQ